ncbi:zinc finger protein 629 isoform X1 [Ctenopharyngodon idella]|uniref:zinc finger protein 629 isoform X1 n=1 Tax=Ctenopharyngodon idella TaxID=7959 RepID=UPI00223112D0|nr:zinc finger protein 629 isoform X1 [Ctenopharyngodon idella]
MEGRPEVEPIARDLSCNPAPLTCRLTLNKTSLAANAEMVKRCVFGCFPLKTLFPIPKTPWLRSRWLEFLHFEEGGITENSRLCSRHFTRECFQNLTQHEMGFAKVLCLTDTAVPSVYTVGNVTSQTVKPPAQDVACQCPAYGQRKSVSVQTAKSKRRREEVNLNFVKINENHDGESQTETHTGDTSAQTFTLNEDGIKSIQIKEEHMEDGQWDSGPISPALCPLGPDVEDQDSFSMGTTGAAREGSDFILTSKMKPGGMWNSPISEEYPANSGAQSLDASPLETGERFATGLSPNRRHDPNAQQYVDEPYRTAAANHALPSASEHRGDTNAERSSRCPQCGKTFTTRFYLKIHQRIHTGERPYTCPQCGKRFYCNSHLISHQRSHTGEKPYSCEECGKSYSHLNSLKLHQRSHTEEEAYAYW